MLLRCPTARAAASARWVRCRAGGGSGPDEAPRSQVTRVRRRRRVTREGANGPSRPEHEIAGAETEGTPPVPVTSAPGGSPPRARTRAYAAADTAASARRPQRPSATRGGGRGRERRSRSSLDDAKSVNAALANTRSLRELADVVTRHDNAKLFNVINVATAYSRLGRHVRDDERGSLNTQGWYLSLELRMIDLLPDLKPWSASSVTWSLARLERDPGGKFWTSLETLLTQHASELEPQGVANVLWAFAVLERRMPPGLRNKLEGAATGFCGFDEGQSFGESEKERPRERKSFETNSKAGERPRERSFDSNSGNGERKPRDTTTEQTFKPYEMTMAFWALTRFGERVSPDLSHAFERKCAAVANLLKPKELANVASAYGRVGGGDSLLPHIAAAAVTRAGLDQFTPNEFANTIWGFAKAGCKSIDEAVISSFLENFAERVNEFDPRDLSLTMWALATLSVGGSSTSGSTSGSTPGSTPGSTSGGTSGSNSGSTSGATASSAPWLGRVERRVVQTIGTYNPQDLSTLLWAFAKLEFVPSFEFQASFEERAIGSIETCETQNLANMAWAYAALALPGAASVLPLVSEKFEALLRDDPRKINPTELVMVLWAYAKFGFDPGAESMSNLESACLKVVDQMQPDQLTQYLWASASLRYRPRFCFLRKYEARAQSAPARFDTEVRVWYFPNPKTVYSYHDRNSYQYPLVVRYCVLLSCVKACFFYKPALATETTHLFRVTTQAVTLTLWAYATLGLAPGTKLLERFADELETIGDFHKHHNGKHNDKHNDAGSVGCSGCIFKPQDLSLGFWSAAVLVTQPSTVTVTTGVTTYDVRQTQLVRIVTSFASHLPFCDPHLITPQGLSAVFAATLALKALTPGLHASLEGKWAHLSTPAETQWRVAKTKNPTVSKLQCDVGLVLESMRIPHVAEMPVGGGLIRPDFVLIGTFPPGGTEFWEGGDDEGDDDTNKNPANPTNPTYQRIVVEVDGPFHYSREPSRDTLGGDGLEDWFSGGNGGGGGVNGDDDDCESPASAPKGVGRDGDGDHENGNGRWPLGSTVLRNQLLAAWGMRVVTVTYHEWERLGTRSAKETHVAGLLENASAMDAGEKQ